MAKLEQLWSEIRLLLSDAGELLPACAKVPEAKASSNSMLVGNWQEFEEFFDQDEFELAWDALATLGQRHQAHDEFWLIMEKAASLMGLRAKKEHVAEKRKINSFVPY